MKKIFFFLLACNGHKLTQSYLYHHFPMNCSFSSNCGGGSDDCIFGVSGSYRAYLFISCADGPWLMITQFTIFWPYKRVEAVHSRNLTWNFEFWSFPGHQHVVAYSLIMLGSGHERQFPLGHVNGMENNQYSIVFIFVNIF